MSLGFSSQTLGTRFGNATLKEPAFAVEAWEASATQ